MNNSHSHTYCSPKNVISPLLLTHTHIHSYGIFDRKTTINYFVSEQKLSLPARYDDKSHGASSKRGVSPSRRTLHFLDGLQHIFQSNNHHHSHSKHNASVKSCNGDLSPIVIVPSDDSGEDAAVGSGGRSDVRISGIGRANSCNSQSDIISHKTSIHNSRSSASARIKNRHSQIESTQNVTRIVIKADNETDGKLFWF